MRIDKPCLSHTFNYPTMSFYPSDGNGGVISRSPSETRLRIAVERLRVLEDRVQALKVQKTILNKRRGWVAGARETLFAAVEAQESKTEQLRRFLVLLSELKYYERIRAEKVEPWQSGLSEDPSEVLVDLVKHASSRRGSYWNEIISRVIGPVPYPEYPDAIQELLAARKQRKESQMFADFWQKTAQKGDRNTNVTCPTPSKRPQSLASGFRVRGSQVDDFLKRIKDEDSFATETNDHRLSVSSSEVVSSSSLCTVLPSSCHSFRSDLCKLEERPSSLHSEELYSSVHPSGNAFGGPQDVSNPDLSAAQMSILPPIPSRYAPAPLQSSSGYISIDHALQSLERICSSMNSESSLESLANDSHPSHRPPTITSHPSQESVRATPGCGAVEIFPEVFTVSPPQSPIPTFSPPPSSPGLTLIEALLSTPPSKPPPPKRSRLPVLKRFAPIGQMMPTVEPKPKASSIPVPMTKQPAAKKATIRDKENLPIEMKQTNVRRLKHIQSWGRLRAKTQI
ncbi:uncharacterized protein EV420DRAFT_1567429 [Desarmillaria tabescens]|uniref:Uncharacterized protein n=1 Tax=Armillaria tabescens TaxID=1929756 RepID=A0AA39MV84_ARMTA|nr:uncharacterized protein EV420DRAFT_1567429 [Desarmillaria tabescens]KAK0448321.1 hypothetical protein EV420DRAFT_1567429 [Desarmillaria tabescens]